MKKSNFRIICPFCHKTIYTYYSKAHPGITMDWPLSEKFAFEKSSSLIWDKHLRHMDICKKYKEAELKDGASLIQQDF